MQKAFRKPLAVLLSLVMVLTMVSIGFTIPVFAADNGRATTVDVLFDNEFDFDAWADSISTVTGTSLPFELNYNTNTFIMRGNSTGRPESYPTDGANAYHMKLIPGHTYRVTADITNLGNSTAENVSMNFVEYNSPSDTFHYQQNEQYFSLISVDPNATETLDFTFTPSKEYIAVIAFAGSSANSYSVKYSNIYVRDMTDPAGNVDLTSNAPNPSANPNQANKLFDFAQWADTVLTVTGTNIAPERNYAQKTYTLIGDGTGRPETYPTDGANAYHMKLTPGHTYRVKADITNLGSSTAENVSMNFVEYDSPSDTFQGSQNRQFYSLINIAPNATGTLDFTFTPSKEYIAVIAFAGMSSNSYKVRYSNIQVSDLTSTTSIGSLPADPTLKGYHLTGWYDNQDANGNGTGTQYTASSTMTPNTLQLFSRWEPNVYCVTLDNQSATTAGTAVIYEKYSDL